MGLAIKRFFCVFNGAFGAYLFLKDGLKKHNKIGAKLKSMIAKDSGVNFTNILNTVFSRLFKADKIGQKSTILQKLSNHQNFFTILGKI
jgi:hypothetical protein